MVVHISNSRAYILTTNNYRILKFSLTFDDNYMSTIVYEMVANNVTYNGKYCTCCTGGKLAYFATGCTSELKELITVQICI